MSILNRHMHSVCCTKEGKMKKYKRQGKRQTPRILRKFVQIFKNISTIKNPYNFLNSLLRFFSVNLCRISLLYYYSMVVRMKRAGDKIKLYYREPLHAN